MGKYDDAMYQYLSDNDRFADLFNAVLFGGEKVLRGELLESASERHVEKLEDYEEEGGYNMCLVVDEMRRDWEAKGRAEGENGIIINMFKKGFTLEQIADATDKGVEEIQAIIESKS